MNVLILGSGGREHALAWKIQQSPLVARTLVAPGNAGTQASPTLETHALPSMDAAAVRALCERERVDFVVVGPEAPLVDGLADALREAGILVLGPSAAGARLEGSKAFSKEIMDAAGVPTARYAQVRTPDEIDAFIDGFDGDALVVKADGLAAGKGVVVCDGLDDARAAALAMLHEQPFGAASETIVLEERLLGIETSYIVLTDGQQFVAMPTSQDHKRLLDGDQGPNTGGMGAYSPAPFVSDEVCVAIEEQVIVPTLAELRRREIPFRGFLYAGIMLTAAGPRVLEFNVRLGDPETQALMMALRGDLVPALLDAARGALPADTDLGPCDASAVVVLAAAGYPSAPEKGACIRGLTDAAAVEDAVVFHAGTATKAQDVVVAGGRVLGVTAKGATPEAAIARAYEAVERIRWDGMQFRRDIGKALAD